MVHVAEDAEEEETRHATTVARYETDRDPYLAYETVLLTYVTML